MRSLNFLNHDDKSRSVYATATEMTLPLYPGPHTFRAVVSSTHATSVMVEWRAQNNRTIKWAQGIIVSANGTVVVPVNEEQTFEDGDRLRLVVFAGTIGTVWGSLSLK
jgi:hypothetical protein